MSAVRWFRPATSLLTVMKFVPVNSSVILLVRRDGLCRLQSVAVPVPPSPDIVPLLVEPFLKHSESRSSIATYCLRIGRLVSGGEKPEKYEVVVSDEVYTYLHAVERKVYNDVARFVRQYLKASEEEKQRLRDWAYKSAPVHDKAVFTWVLSLLEQIELRKDETVVPFSVKISEREYEGSRLRRKNYYIIYLAKVGKKKLLEVINSVLEVAGVKWKRSRRRRGGRLRGIVILLDDSRTWAYHVACRILNRLVNEKRVVKVAPRVYIFENVSDAEQVVKLLRAYNVRVQYGKVVLQE